MPQLVEILKEALQIEKEGEEFYRGAAETCTNPVAKHTFLALADQEHRHAQYFQAFYDAMVQEGQWPAPGVVDWEAVPVPDAARSIFDQARCKAASCDVVMCAELTQLYASAMEQERQTITLYRTQAEGATDDDEQAFFEFLVAQERGHLELLANTQKYLDAPAQWFFDEEQWIVEG